MYIVPSDIFVSYKLVPEVRMSYKFATPQYNIPPIGGIYIPCSGCSDDEAVTGDDTKSVGTSAY